MPELPEVETVRRGLESILLGAKIDTVVVRNRRLRWPIPPDFEVQLAGLTVVRVERRSKYLLFRLSATEFVGAVPPRMGSQPGIAVRPLPQVAGTMLAHLGMTGSFIAHRAETLPASRTHDHVEIQLTTSDGAYVLRYNDPRRFGSMHFFVGDDVAQPLLAHLGPEPLTDAFTSEYLYRETRRRSGPIKQALMDNTLVVGVGNIYANESLFRAGIHPNRAANRISRARYAKLVHEVKTVLVEAIAAGGSTLRDFVNTSGEPGYFQLDYFVYGRDGKPCKVCATPLKLMRQGGRATVFCAVCQR
ncbi:MAG: bifunctional DNA-formamidopyrimidine glycosylase/DNA-(apurinic or apyrimidinic site) lyase [Casimicrobium sp.]